MSSQGVIEAEEVQSSTRSGSRYNAVTHGLTAKTAVLPGEDPEAFQAKVDLFKSDMETRTPLEDELAEKAALASWQLERANHAEVARLKRDRLTKPAAASLRAELEAVALGQRLFFDRRGPTELYPSRDYENKQPRTSWDDVPDDPDHPARLIPQLEATLAGCRLLLKFWGELRGVLDLGLCWLSHEKLKVCRLLGKQPINAASSREVAEVFLACHAVNPRSSYAFRELRCEIHEDRFKIHKADLDRWEQAGITPADATAGRAVLLRIVDEATGRLRILEATRQKLADVVGELDTRILNFDESKSGDQLRRHMGSCNRLMLRNIEAVRKGHRDEAKGWGRTRKERERKKAEKGAGSQLDERLVLNDEGDVCIAEDYDGDIEAGMARYEKALGLGTPRPRRAVLDAVVPPVVPDFARWKPSDVVTEISREGEGVGCEAIGDGPEKTFGLGVGVVIDTRRTLEGVPLMPDAEGERANLQNEVGEAGGAIEDGAEQTFGQGDGGVRDPRRTEGGGAIEDGAEETFGQGDGGARDPRRTEGGGAIEDGAEETFGQGDGGARDSRRTEGATGHGAAETGGQGDGGVGDPLRTGKCMPLTPVAEGERANRQNETGELALGGGCRAARHGAERRGEMEAPEVGLPDQAAGGGGPVRVCEREEKLMREEMNGRDLERSAGRNRETDDATVEEKIKSIEWLFPNAAKVLRQHHSRSP
jgi:hypothetical protein